MLSKECKYDKKEVIRDITEDLKIPFDDDESNEEQVKCLGSLLKKESLHLQKVFYKI